MLKVTKENFQELNQGDVVCWFVNGRNCGTLNVFTYFLSTLEVEVTRETKKQIYFGHIKKDGTRDKRKSTVSKRQIFNTYVEYFKL